MSGAQPAPTDLDRHQLKAKLERKDPFKLVMASSDWAFRAKHLPGSIHFKSPEEMFSALGKDEEIVVYCSNFDCHASLATIQKLREHGYQKVRHYAGGLVDWETAGLPLEGDWT
jgi:rhodanese-related sulfurtransferase